MKTRRWWWLGGMLLLLLWLPPHPVAAQTSPASVRFAEVPCVQFLDDVSPDTLAAMQPAACGFLTVPKNYADPNGPTIRLGVVQIYGTASTSNPPLFIAQGGPGGSTIDVYMQVLPSSTFFERRERDLVLFDQRGTYYSEPFLFCEEVFDLTLETLDQELSDEESLALSLAATDDCRMRFTTDGIDLSAFDSVENARDVRSLRDALGYDVIDFYGVSYGTELAQVVMRDHPDILRSVVLDAVVSPVENFLLEVPQSQQRAFDALFAACAAEPACATAFPDLEDMFYIELNRLNDQPARITLRDSDTGESYPALLDGDSFADLIFQMLYSTDFIPLLPLVIDEVRRDSFGVIEMVAALVIFDRTFADGMYLSVVCADDAVDMNPADINLEGVRPELAEGQQESVENFQQACAVWAIEPLTNRMDTLLTSPIPTLLLSGYFDPITPPANAEAVASALPISYHFVNPIGGHGQAFEGGCVDALMTAFLTDPMQAPDGSCLEEQTSVNFITRDDIIALPALFSLLNLEAPATLWMGLLAVAILTLLSIWLVAPLSWLISRIAGREREPLPFSAHLAPWLVALLSLVLVSLLGGLISVIVMLATENDNRLLFGLPSEYGALLALPLVALGLTGGLVWLTVQAWRVPYWGGLRRVYYSLLSGAAVLAVAMLASLGLLRVAG